MITYDILIPTIPHRHGMLNALLREVDRQWRPGLGVIVYRDNLEHGLRHKNQALMEASGADYVSWLDDDDWLAPDYVTQVMTVLARGPDYVGFRVGWSVDGVMQVPVEHSLRHTGWVNAEDGLTRDVTALNPVRRELALLGNWESFAEDHGADKHWSAQVAQHCQSEEFIAEVMYFYRYRSKDSFLVPREPEKIMPQLPSYPWLTSIGS